MYLCHAELLDAIMSAFKLATEQEKSQTIYTPVNGPELYLVGHSSGAPDMIEAGAMPLFSVQAHMTTAPAVPVDPWVAGYHKWAQTQIDRTEGCAVRWSRQNAPTWADREEEVS
jgi:hypothetical protein